jgi:hypothetical protein
MNRRSFLKFLGTATVGTGIVYSFPSIIVPKNISSSLLELPEWTGLPAETIVSQVNLITQREIFPKLIEDFWFTETPFFAYLRKNAMESFAVGEFTKDNFKYNGEKWLIEDHSLEI